MDAGSYNYPIFPPEDDVEAFSRFHEYLKVGHRAPDPELVDLASGEPVRLSSLTQHGITIVEFGSLT